MKVTAACVDCDAPIELDDTITMDRLAVAFGCRCIPCVEKREAVTSGA